MGKFYINPFDWNYADDNILIYDSYSSKSDDEIKEMINEALSEALEDTLDNAVDGAVDEAISNMDIKLEGENLLYKLIVNGNENGEINIPKDQFLKSTYYDSESKKLVFVMETANGETTTEVSISELVASIEDGVGQIQGKLTQIDEKDNAQDAALNSKADASALENLATKAEVQAVDAKVDAIVIPDVSGFATKQELASVVSPLAVKAEVTEEINSAVDGLNAAIADKADASSLEVLATKAEVQAVDTKVDAIVIPDVSGLASREELATAVAPLAAKTDIPDVSGLAVKSEVTEEINAVSDALSQFETQVGESLNAKADASALESLATKAEVQAIDAKVDAIEVPSIEGLAVASEVTAEIAAAVEPLAAKTDIPDVSGFAVKSEVTEEINSAVDSLNASIVSKADKSEIPDVSGFALASDVTNEIATAVAPLATKAEVEAVDAKVDAIVIPDVSGFAVASDVTAEIATAVAGKANSSDIPTRTSELVNDSNFITSHQSLEEYAKKSFVNEEIAKIVGGAPETLDTLKEIADALQDNATMEMVSEAISTKANAEDVYNKSEVYNKQESEEMFQVSGNYVPVEDYNALVQKVAALENYVNIFIKDREEKMDEIINNMDADNKEVVIETPMESIVVPETTVAYTITAPLADNSTVELTSPKYMTLFNTSDEPVSTSIGHTFVEGESTSATTVYLVGNFDTLTLENVSPAVKSGYDAASVNNVVISENNVKNLTLALDIQDGATIRNNSNASITIQDKNDMATTLTIVAPNSTVTLNGSNYEVVNATVSDHTLIVKKTVGHIGTLNVSKGNVIVEVPRQSLIAEKIGEYTIAEGYTIDYLHDEIDSNNVANLAKEGTHTLVEDVTKSGNFSVGTFSTDDMIWDLNGHSITSSNTRGYGIFRLRGSAHLEINDSVGTGSVVNTDDDYGLWTGTVGSKIVINGGHFEASTHVLYAEKGTIEVNGGSFRLTNEDTADKDEFGNFKFLVNCHDADYTSGEANVIIRGGKFYGWNPSASYGEPGGPVSFVAEGYGVVESIEDGMKVYTVVAD